MTQTASAHIEFHKCVNGRVVERFRVSDDVCVEIEQLLEEKGYSVDEHHGNCQAVVIFGEIDEDTYARRVAECGAQPITDQRWFPSAVAASRHFGYQHNAVVQALSRAKQRGQTVAVVGGVPVCKAVDVPGTN